MPFREPSPAEIREVLLEIPSPRTGLSTLAPGESPRKYLREVYGHGAEDLDDAEKKAVARRLRSGGIASSAIASILRMDSKKSTVDRWVEDCTPETSIGFDGRIRRPKNRVKKKARGPEPEPEPEPLELTAEAPTPRAVLDALIALRRARIPVKDRQDYLRRFRGLPASATDSQRRETARALASEGFTASVISPIVGIPRATVYRWIGDVESGLRYGIRGTELGDGTGREAENLF